jgi:hypothetical protein
MRSKSPSDAVDSPTSGKDRRNIEMIDLNNGTSCTLQKRMIISLRDSVEPSSRIMRPAGCRTERIFDICFGWSNDNPVRVASRIGFRRATDMWGIELIRVASSE